MASPLAPPSNASTGVMQQSDAPIAAKIPTIQFLLFFVVVFVIKSVAQKYYLNY